MGFRNLRLFYKLMLAFILCGGFTAAIGVYSGYRMSQLNVVVLDMNENWMPGVRALLGMKAGFLEFRTRQLAMTGAKDKAQLDEFIEFAKGDLARYRKDEADYKRTIASAEEQKLYEQLLVPVGA